MYFVGIHSFNTHINAMEQVVLSHRVTTPLLVPVLILLLACAPLLLWALLLAAHTCCFLQKLAIRLLEPFCSKRARDNLSAPHQPSNDLTPERVQRLDPFPPEAQTPRCNLHCRAARDPLKLGLPSLAVPLSGASLLTYPVHPAPFLDFLEALPQ